MAKRVSVREFLLCFNGTKRVGAMPKGRPKPKKVYYRRDPQKDYMPAICRALTKVPHASDTE